MSKWSRINMDAPIDCSAINAALHLDPAYLAERAAGQAAIDALFEPHFARVRADQEARWAREEAEGEALVARMNLEGSRA